MSAMVCLIERALEETRVGCDCESKEERDAHYANSDRLFKAAEIAMRLDDMTNASRLNDIRMSYVAQGLKEGWINSRNLIVGMDTPDLVSGL